MVNLISKSNLLNFELGFFKEQEFIKQNLIKKAKQEIDKKVDLSKQLEEKAKEKIKEEELKSTQEIKDVQNYNYSANNQEYGTY